MDLSNLVYEEANRKANVEIAEYGRVSQKELIG